MRKHFLIYDNLYSLIEDLLVGRITLDSFLQHMLRGRLNYLMDRTKKVAKFALDKKIFYAPTDSWLFEFFMRDKALLALKKLYKEDQRNYDERFKLCNLIIKTAFSKMTQFEQFTTDTLDLLCASPQLHPLLQDKTKDLGDLGAADGWAIYGSWMKEAYKNNILTNDPYSLFRLCFFAV